MRSQNKLKTPRLFAMLLLLSTSFVYGASKLSRQQDRQAIAKAEVDFEKARAERGLAMLPMLFWIGGYGIQGRSLPTVITTGLLVSGLLVHPLLPASWLTQPQSRLATRLAVVAIGWEIGSSRARMRRVKRSPRPANTSPSGRSKKMEAGRWWRIQGRWIRPTPTRSELRQDHVLAQEQARFGRVQPIGIVLRISPSVS